MLARKSLIVVVQTLVPGSLNSALSFVLLLFIAVGALCLQYTYLPYQDVVMNRTETAALLVNTATLLLSVYVSYAHRSAACLVHLDNNQLTHYWLAVHSMEAARELHGSTPLPV